MPDIKITRYPLNLGDSLLRQYIGTSALLCLSLTALAQPSPIDDSKYRALLDPSPKVREEALF